VPPPRRQSPVTTILKPKGLCIPQAIRLFSILFLEGGPVEDLNDSITIQPGGAPQLKGLLP